MHIFHKWSKWSEVYEDSIRSTYGIYKSQVQHRTCTTCGKYKWRKA